MAATLATRVTRHRLRWLTDVPRPYTSVLFRALASSENIDLEVYYSRASMGSHPWNESIDSGFRSRLYRTRAGIDWRLARAALRDRKDIFVVAGWNDPTLLTVSLVRRLFGFRYWIYTDTPDFEWLPRGRFKSWVRSLWLRLILGGAERVMGTGRPALERLATLGARADRLTNLPYFIDIDHYRHSDDPAPHERAADARVVFGSAGQLVPRKQLATALRALGHLARQGHSNWSYRVIGTGPELESLEAIAREEGIEDRVEWLGWLEGDALVDFFERCDVFIHPCEFEPWGVVVMEAMVSGSAVVCSDRTFVAIDWVVPQENGLLHVTFDAQDLATKLEWLLEDPARGARLGHAARETVLEWPVGRGVREIERLAALE
jgi:glycosyltransferase involved in cell wall biosynthesis